MKNLAITVLIIKKALIKMFFLLFSLLCIPTKAQMNFSKIKIDIVLQKVVIDHDVFPLDIKFVCAWV